MKFRLLTTGDKIQGTDQRLNDDCETWTPIQKGSPIFIGMTYARNAFVPVRRPMDHADNPKF